MWRGAVDRRRTFSERKLLIYIKRIDISNIISGQFQPKSKRPAVLELH